MIPVANFLISPNLLVVKFTDTSTGTPTSWSWDFGDSTSSTSQNPTKTYSTAGTFTVKLTVTNSSGSSYLQRQLVVATTPVLPVPLKTFVSLKLPSGISISEETKDAYIAQWQLFIQPLVDPVVDLSNVFNETSYPPLANALVAMLAAYSIITDIAAQGGAFAAGAGTNGNSGLVKKIVTGPSEAEFQDLGNAQKTLNNILMALQKEICTLSHRLLIKLPMCPPLPDPKIIELKAGRISQSVWSQYPWQIPLTI